MAQEAFARQLAIMVYNYLLEWRMEPLAAQFAATCPVMANEYQTPDHGMLSTIPYRRLHDVMWEHIELLDAMRQTIQLFHKEVPIPFGATSWDKIKVILDYFYVKSTAPPIKAGDGAKQATGTDVNFVDDPATEPTSVGNAINLSEQSFNLSEFIQPIVVHTPSPELEVQLYQPPEPCTNNANEPNTTGMPELLYLGRYRQPQLNTIFNTKEGNGQQLQHAIKSDVIDLTQSEEIVHPPPDANDPVPEVANLNPEPTAPVLASLPMLEMDASMEKVLTPPQPLLAEPEKNNPEPEETITVSEKPETKSVIMLAKSPTKTTTGKQNEDESPGQNSILVSSSSEPVCRLNLSSPKRNLSNRTPSSSTAKRTKQSPTISSDLTNVPTLDVTKQCTGGAKLAKQIQQPTEEAGPPPTPLSPANRRPIRACTVNKKRGIEQSYNRANVLSPELATSCIMRSDSFGDNPSAGTQDEAAIDAVLTKLHGEK